MGKVIHFEIPVDDGGRATTFYGQVFGWPFEQWGDMPFWSTAAGEGPGIGGALAQREPGSTGLMFYISVPDISAALVSVERHGGRIENAPMPIPGVGWMAHFVDSEGNRVGVFEEDPSATMP